MPKRSGEIPKAKRVKHVFEAVRRLGKSSPEMVMQAVASKLDLDATNPNFRRNIYRDLKSLETSGEIDKRCFSPAGEEIDVHQEDDHENFRLEYSVPGSNAQVLGGDLLLTMGGRLQPSKKSKVSWTISLLSKGFQTEAISMIFQNHRNELLTLNLPINEVPLKLLIARDPENAPSGIDNLEVKLGRRSAALLLKEKSISRTGDSKLGHAILEFSENAKEVKITDLGSTNGTTFQPTTQNSFQHLYEVATNQTTIQKGEQLFDKVGKWTPVGLSGEPLELPLFISFGSFRMLLCYPNRSA